MKYKKIRSTDLSISAISLGTWVFGGDNWAGAQEKDCIDAIDKALECGINLIDTAPIYGYGMSEEIVGKAIKGKRNKVILATKCGLIGKGAGIKPNLNPDSIKKEIEQSLKRLQVDCIDIYQCHWPDPNTPIEKTMAELNNLKKQGKIKHIGLSNFGIDSLKKAAGFSDIVTLQSHYSLLERSIEKDILPFCIEKGIGVISYGSLGGGILSGKYKSPTKFSGPDARNFFYKYYDGDGFKKASKTIALMQEISAKIKRPLNQIALNWIRQKQGAVSAIVGCRNPEQAKANALAGSWELSREDIDRLNAT